MKKSIAAVLSAAMLTAMSTSTFAAANPFSDVPSDSWAYDAISQLAKDGVIEGYGDNTFKGDKAITRYEMAQMVAKAMAKQDVSAQDKNLIDKLQSEFSTELNNLGVRVAKLERNADAVKFSGYAYVREQHQSINKKRTGVNKDTNTDRVLLDLMATARVNDNWKVVSETNTFSDMNTDGIENDMDLYFVSIFAQGDYGHNQYQFGRMDTYTNDFGLIMHNSLSGGTVTFGNKWKTKLTAARIVNAQIPSLGGADFAGDLQAIENTYKSSKATTLYLNGYHLHDSQLKTIRGSEDPYLYEAGFVSKLNKNWKISGFYVHATASNDTYTKQDAYFGQIDYKGMKLQNVGTYGLYLKYAYLPEQTQIGPDVAHFRDYKGFELGCNYVPWKNVRAHVRYYYGKNVQDSSTVKNLYRAELRYFF